MISFKHTCFHVFEWLVEKIYHFGICLVVHTPSNVNDWKKHKYIFDSRRKNNNNKNNEKVHAVFGKLLINIFQHEELHIKA